MKKSKLGALIVVVSMLLSQVTAVTAAPANEKNEPTNPTYDIFLDGDKLSLSAPPLLQNGTTLVPFRSVFERLGLSVSWNAQTKQITGKSEERTIVLTVGSVTAIVNGKNAAMPLAPVVFNNTTYIPLRFAGTASGGEVELYQGGLNVVWMLSALQKELHLAVVAKDKDQVERLLKRGADPEVLIGPIGPAIFLFADDAKDIIALFIKHGMDINVRSSDYSGYTLLHNAVRKGRTEVVKFLLDNGADSSVHSGSGSTPLELAEFWREQVRYGYKDHADQTKTPTIQDYDETIALLKDHENKK